MSTRKTILDAVVSGLNKSTSINYVTQDVEPWWEWKDGRFPGVTIIDAETEINRLAYESTSADDMEARMTIQCRGFVKDRRNILAVKRTNLISEIESTLKTSTDISDATADVFVTNIDTDKGMVDNFSVCEVTAEVLYFYNHLSP